ncbi:hypothetical protein Droror1_Dr00020922 [Drosera rotundifolia]
MNGYVVGYVLQVGSSAAGKVDVNLIQFLAMPELRMLLFQVHEGRTLLCGESYASQLPGVFRVYVDMRKDITVLRCGHTIYLECAQDMENHFRDFRTKGM